MRSNKPWLVVVGFLLVFALSASSALATTTYLRGYVRPSGDGGINCSNPTVDSCVNVIQSVSGANISVTGDAVNVLNFYDVVEFSVGTGLNTIDALPLNLLGIQAGDTITFEFTALPATITAGGTNTSTFGLLGCDTNTQINGTNIGAIFSSINTGTTGSVVTTYCTNSTNANLAGDGTSGVAKDGNPSVSYTFGSGVVIPSQLAFAFPDPNLDESFIPLAIDITGPAGGNGGGTMPTPEPASMTLLAAGLVGLGFFRRKRAA
jgi:hypothetical protein